MSEVAGLYHVGRLTQEELAKQFSTSRSTRRVCRSRRETLRAALLRNENVRRTLDRARTAYVALVGVGDMSEDSNMIRMGWLFGCEVDRAQATGTVGDILGNDFLDIRERPSRSIVSGLVVGLTLKDLEVIKDVAVVASEKTKAAILLGVLRTGMVDMLATTLSNANAVPDLDEATRRDR